MKLTTVGSGSKGNSYILESHGEILILDCGVPYQRIEQALNYRIADVQAILLTHKHNDHVLSFKDFMFYGLKVCGCDELQDELEIVNGEKITALAEKKQERFGRFAVTPFYLPHDGTPNFGYLISDTQTKEKLLYATDFEYIPYRFTKLNIDYFLLECNHMDELAEYGFHVEHVLRGHSSLSVVKEFLRINQTGNMKHVVLCHLSSTNANKTVMKKEIDDVVGENIQVDIATPKITIELGEKHE